MVAVLLGGQWVIHWVHAVREEGSGWALLWRAREGVLPVRGDARWARLADGSCAFDGEEGEELPLWKARQWWGRAVAPPPPARAPRPKCPGEACERLQIKKCVRGMCKKCCEKIEAEATATATAAEKCTAHTRRRAANPQDSEWGPDEQCGVWTPTHLAPLRRRLATLSGRELRDRLEDLLYFDDVVSGWVEAVAAASGLAGEERARALAEAGCPNDATNAEWCEQLQEGVTLETDEIRELLTEMREKAESRKRAGLPPAAEDGDAGDALNLDSSSSDDGSDAGEGDGGVAGAGAAAAAAPRPSPAGSRNGGAIEESDDAAVDDDDDEDEDEGRGEEELEEDDDEDDEEEDDDGRTFINLLSDDDDDYDDDDDDGGGGGGGGGGGADEETKSAGGASGKAEEVAGDGAEGKQVEEKEEEEEEEEEEESQEQQEERAQQIKGGLQGSGPPGEKTFNDMLEHLTANVSDYMVEGAGSYDDSNFERVTRQLEEEGKLRSLDSRGGAASAAPAPPPRPAGQPAKKRRVEPQNL